MTEQPPPSAEALEIADYQPLADVLRRGLAREIDALCEQRVSAETERCARYHDERGRLVSRSSAYQQAWHEMAARDIRAPAARPAPPQPTYTEEGIARADAIAADILRGIGVEQRAKIPANPAVEMQDERR